MAPEGRSGLWSVGRSRWLLGAFPVTLAISMLLAHYNVVRDAVDQSALRKQVLATRSNHIWRCTLQPRVLARQDCMLAIPKPLADGHSSTLQVSQ